ncbi:peptidoglycan recognition protein family protein [Streptomyces beihaiensis]|uniref:Peptidoglycan recognition protein n=1 Tax=Streptomyces beihaiensis TaxID=2984495 RepID=A0ABT3U3L0_9ACTN|nr:peptidoglycan recognition protein [Streptomyces beihaiensis]MCX3063923.1 peptidoglycan recognition protein [Streptomyces beihaiensis]
MRGFLASSIGVTCAAALALPIALTAPTPSHAAAPIPAQESLPGSTQSLRLAPLPADRAAGTPQEEGVTRRDVHPFSLVGVVWDDPRAQLDGRVQVRTRATGTTTWSAWQDLQAHNDDAPDPDSPEGEGAGVRGSTAPLWVGDSDGVEVRVKAAPPNAAPESPETKPATQAPPHPGAASTRASTASSTASSTVSSDGGVLPQGLRLELVDPGQEPTTTTQGAPADDPADASRSGTLTPETAQASAANAGLAPLGADVIPALTKKQTEDALTASAPAGTAGAAAAPEARPYIGARPRIITRKGWGADEKLRERKFAYTRTVKAAFIHHTATGNNYRCSQAPSVIRGIYRYHVKSLHWRDIGYNFLIDKCGRIYEGRAGGVAKPVRGAHTMGFNTDSMGVAVLGTFGRTKPSAASVNAVARLTAWKLGLFRANPRGVTHLKSGGGNLFRKGKNVRLDVISGHRDGYATECPGDRLYKRLGSARRTAAHLQGRP